MPWTLSNRQNQNRYIFRDINVTWHRVKSDRTVQGSRNSLSDVKWHIHIRLELEPLDVVEIQFGKDTV